MNGCRYRELKVHNDGCMNGETDRGREGTNGQNNGPMGRWKDRQVGTWTDEWMQVQRVEGTE
jgi:hypothetical protein